MANTMLFLITEIILNLIIFNCFFSFKSNHVVSSTLSIYLFFPSINAQFEDFINIIKKIIKVTKLLK